MQTFAALFSFAVAFSLFLCEGCYHSGYLVRTYARNDCSGDICSIEGAITPGTIQHQLQVAVFSDPADTNGSLSQLSRVNLTLRDMYYEVPKVEFTWGTAQRVIVLLICLTDDSDCGLVEESGDDTQGNAELYRFPCPVQSKCHLCPQEREVLDNYTLSLGEHALPIHSVASISSSNDCPTGTTRECIVPSSTADLTSAETTAISTSNFPTTSTSVDINVGTTPIATIDTSVDVVTTPTTSTSMDGSATSTGICITTSPQSSEIPTCDGDGVRPFSKLSLLLLVMCAAVALGVMWG